MDSNPVRNAYLRFEIGGLTAPVSRATLRIYSRTAHWLGLEVRGVADTGWDEETLLFDNAPEFSAAATSSSGSIGLGSWVELDVTPLVAGNGAVAFALTTSSVTNLPVAMKESGETLAPQLVIETQASSSSETTTPIETTAPSETTPTETTPTTPTDTTQTETTPTETSPTETTPVPDTTPPSVPGGLAAIGATETSISISWAAATDDVGVSGYGVYRDGALVDSIPETTFTLSGLLCGSSYSVAVDAYDAAGNRSVVSPPATLGTSSCPDRVAPSAPASLRAVEATASSVSVAWEASTDDVAVTGYRLYRGGAYVATTAALEYTFDALACGSGHEFSIDALDAAGNVSERAALTATTAACTSDPVVAIAGDIAGTGSGDSATAALLDSLQPTAVLAAGDNAYPDGSLAQYNQYYGPTWGRHKELTFPTPGNHEYSDSDAAGYFDYFGARAGDPRKGWYSFDLGSWHLISLNSELDHDAGSEQVTWLKDDLAATSASCVLAYWHKPRFSAGQYGDSSGYRPFWDALYAAGAEVVINGHDHNYQRYVPMTPAGARDDARGIREFVVGTGGRSHYGLRTDSRREAGDATAYGVLVLKLGQSGYDWTFVPEAGKTFRDSGSAGCH